MKIITAAKAKNSFIRLIDEVATESKPILITGKRNNAFLISEEDWNSIQETLYMVSIPGMRKSIIEGKKEPIENFSDN